MYFYSFKVEKLDFLIILFDYRFVFNLKINETDRIETLVKSSNCYFKKIPIKLHCIKKAFVINFKM